MRCQACSQKHQGMYFLTVGTVPMTKNASTHVLESIHVLESSSTHVLEGTHVLKRLSNWEYRDRVSTFTRQVNLT